MGFHSWAIDIKELKSIGHEAHLGV